MAPVSPESLNKTAIAVLPFESLSGDPQQRYFSDGISEDIITDLSRLSDLAVIASATSFTYRDSALNAQQIGHELNVGYLLQGSIRKASNRIRITSQLVNTENGHSLWADRFDREITDVFALQDEITGKIVNALSFRLSEAESRATTSHKPSSFAAYDLFLQARAIANNVTRESNDQTIDLYRRAIEIDPDFARAYAALSVLLVRTIIRGYSSDRELTLQQAHELAQRAVELDPESPHTLWALGYTSMNKGEFEQATELLERAVALSPSFADGYGLLSLIENNQGKSQQALEHTRRGMQLNPRYTWDYPYNLARAYWALEEYETALLHLSDASSRNPSLVQPRLYLVSTHMQLGNREDAEWEVTELELQHPEINLTYLRNGLALQAPELREKLFDDLRAAGMAE